jgi:hypothetical protein
MPSHSLPVPARFARSRRRLIVVERGASLLARQEAENFDETVTVAQMRDEAADDFADRVTRRVGAAAHSVPFSEALLYASEATDHATLSARRLIALAIAAHAEATSTPGELVVVASADASSAEREQLLELADDLILGTQGQPLPVRLRFEAATSQVVSPSALEPDADGHPGPRAAPAFQLRVPKPIADRERRGERE